MSAIELPSWIQEVTVFAVACVSVFIGVWKYVNTNGGKEADKPATVNTSQVVAASFVDSKLLKELIDTLRETAEELSRVGQRITRSNSELRESIIENTEAVKLQTDATLNMLRFINRQAKGGPDVS